MPRSKNKNKGKDKTQGQGVKPNPPPPPAVDDLVDTSAVDDKEETKSAKKEDEKTKGGSGSGDAPSYKVPKRFPTRQEWSPGAAGATRPPFHGGGRRPGFNAGGRGYGSQVNRWRHDPQTFGREQQFDGYAIGGRPHGRRAQRKYERFREEEEDDDDSESGSGSEDESESESESDDSDREVDDDDLIDEERDWQAASMLLDNQAKAIANIKELVSLFAIVESTPNKVFFDSVQNKRACLDKISFSIMTLTDKVLPDMVDDVPVSDEGIDEGQFKGKNAASQIVDTKKQEMIAEEKNREIGRLRKEVERLAKAKADLENDKEALAEEVDALRVDNDAQQGVIDLANSRIAKLTTKVLALTSSSSVFASSSDPVDPKTPKKEDVGKEDQEDHEDHDDDDLKKDGVVQSLF